MSLGIRTASGHVIFADEADASQLGAYSWYVNKSRGKLYAQARGDGKKVSMHRLLMNPPKGAVVHHINGNGLDNRRENLEVTSQRQNMRYRHGKEPEAVTEGELYFPYGKRALPEIERLKEVIRRMGEIADLCTYDDIKEICSTCRCRRRPDV